MDPLSVVTSTYKCQRAVSTFIRQWESLLRSSGREASIIVREILDIRLLITEFSARMALYNQHIPEKQILTIMELFSTIVDTLNLVDNRLRGTRPIRSRRPVKGLFERSAGRRVQSLIGELHIKELQRARLMLAHMLSALNKDIQWLAT